MSATEGSDFQFKRENRLKQSNMEPKKEEIEKFTKQYLYNWYNATSTSTSDGKDELETYENWLERQIISRMERIRALEEENQDIKGMLKSSVAYGGELRIKIKELEEENNKMREGYFTLKNLIIDKGCCGNAESIGTLVFNFARDNNIDL